MDPESNTGILLTNKVTMDLDTITTQDSEIANKNLDKNEEKELSATEKIIGLSQLGALFLAGNNNIKAKSILEKAINLYENQKELTVFFSSLYCNYAKCLSVDKQFDLAEPIYKRVIDNHPMKSLLIKKTELLKQNYGIDIEDLYSLISYSTDNVQTLFKQVFTIYSEDYKPPCNLIKNKFNPLSSFSDSLVNLAVIFQIKYKESLTSLKMFVLAMLVEPSNTVANINFNGFLRENNFKELSDDFITHRVLMMSQIKEGARKLLVNPIKANDYTKGNELSFVCMKWGVKYDAEYVNKLYRGIKRNFQFNFKFFCITEDPLNLESEIIILPLNTNNKGWMKKAYLFSNEVTRYLTKRCCFIDLDMVIIGDISCLNKYDGDFCILSTNDIKCEGSKDGYNSSIVLWRNGVGSQIFDFLVEYHDQITKQLVRFDHYLEYIVKNSDFVQQEFPGIVLDYNFYVKGKDSLEDYPTSGIVNFPRHPKPHDCSEQWIKTNWI